MLKFYIDRDERWDWSLSQERQSWWPETPTCMTLTKEESEDYASVMKKYQEWQDRIEEAWDAVNDRP